MDDRPVRVPAEASLRRSQWRRGRRRRRVVAIAATALAVVAALLLAASTRVSVAYRSGHRMVELRDGLIGYYSNPVYRNFTWLDRGREEGLLWSGPARVPPGPYRLYAQNRYWVAVYIKLWHAGALLGALCVVLWWRVGRRSQAGRCFACGYDLQGLRAASQGSVSCPECGAVDDERRVEPAPR